MTSQPRVVCVHACLCACLCLCVQGAACSGVGNQFWVNLDSPPHSLWFCVSFPSLQPPLGHQYSDGGVCLFIYLWNLID